MPAIVISRTPTLLKGRPMDAEDKYSRAIKFYETRQYGRAFRIFEKLANAKKHEAISMMATMYGEGQFVQKDAEKSISFDLRAVELGSTLSLSNLAITFRRKGECRTAYKWFRKAFERGDGDAAVEMAKLLDVSDHEIEKVKALLVTALEHENITVDSREEAQNILNEIALRPPAS
jgi:TPR repeat protein